MIQALTRAFEIMRLTAASANGIRLYELADRMNLKRTTVFNLAATLVSEGMLEKRGGARYVLGPGVREMYLCQERNTGKEALVEQLLELQRKYPAASVCYTERSGGDFLGKIYVPDGIDSKVQYPENMEIDPFWSVAGLLFFALLPDETLRKVLHKHPFEFKGIEVWKSYDNFIAVARKAEADGFSESPASPPEILKFGVPVMTGRNSLRGVITLTFGKNKSKWNRIREFVLDDIFATAEKIKTGV